ncbi:oligogalacturonate-specific porin KdgM family protein, partial [Salmonella enterica]|uniref:oligogalacturonate-specific porin KdgM family protein n=1 Tax=Salmonella enterica TaxID=28901 RepID=UPI003D3163F1
EFNFHVKDIGDVHEKSSIFKDDGYNPVFYRYVNDFHYNNGKKSAYENDLVVKDKLNKTWQPYVEWDYMEQQGKYDDESGLTENRFRVGLTINFE